MTAAGNAATATSRCASGTTPPWTPSRPRSSRTRITGLLGRNGAGKTTLMQLAHRAPGAHPRPGPRSSAPPRTRTTRVLRRHLLRQGGAALPRPLPGQRRPRGRGHAVPRLGRRARRRRWWPTSTCRRKRPVKKLSRGMTSAVGIVIGLASRAPLTLFDEPYLGLDAVARQLFYDRLIADYAEHPRTVVLSTHLIEEIAGLLEHVLLIDRGRVAARRRRGVPAGQRRSPSPGPGDTVQSFARQHELLHTESLGGHSRAVVRIAGAGGPARCRGRGPRRRVDHPPAARRRDEPAGPSRPRPRAPRHLRRPRGGLLMNRVLAGRPPAPRPPAGDPRHALADRGLSFAVNLAVWHLTPGRS